MVPLRLVGWRPAAASFVTAVIAMKDHPKGAEYTATAMRRNVADRDRHEQLGFHGGWGAVTRGRSASLPTSGKRLVVEADCRRVAHQESD